MSLHINMESKGFPPLISDVTTSGGYTYDIFIIEGDPGGLSCAKQAAALGARVGLSQHGKKWGSNANIIKALHHAAALADDMPNQIEAGWGQPEKPKHNWQQFQENMGTLIKVLTEAYMLETTRFGIDYFTSPVSFVDPHTLYIESLKTTVTAKYIVVATGTYQPLDEASKDPIENVITADELSQLNGPPGKTLIWGATPLAAEYAGILSTFGCSVTLLMRNVFLRGYDKDMTGKLEALLKNHGVRIKKNRILAEVKKTAAGKIWVKMQKKTGAIKEDEFDTILIASNRTGATAGLNLAKAGVKLGASGKIRVNDEEQTNVPHIFAVGDVATGRPEYETASIKAGELLAKRLFAATKEKMDYVNFPYVILTPVEYGYCGLTEEDAVTKIGEGKVEVYHTSFKPLEWELLESKHHAQCYTKLLTVKETEEVKGFHYFGPNADSVVQGFSVALSCKATKSMWDKTVGIHPTCAETLIGLTYTKAARPGAKKTGC